MSIDGLLTSEQNLTRPLTIEQLRSAVHKTLSALPKARTVLLIHPDYSRTDFSDVLFRLIYGELVEKGLQRIDTLNAAGTHRAMTEKEKLAKLGIAERAQFAALGELADHSIEPEQLLHVGELPASFMSDKTLGRWPQAIPVSVNKRLHAGYDLILALSGTVPHESAGFAGGLKAFFPGVAGREVIDGLHWAAVQMGIPALIGRIDNPGRDVINAGAEIIFAAARAPMISFNMLCRENGHSAQPHGLFTGAGYRGFIDAYVAAAKASSQIHIVRVDRPLDLVVQELGDGYDEIWTAGKGSYKLQSPGVMAAGGEVVIYQPKIYQFHSNSRMDAAIRELGYHGLDYVLHALENRPDFDRNVASHVINVRGSASYARAARKETDFAFKVSLATSIPADVCGSVALGYRNPATLRREFDSARGNNLWIPNGGKMLYARVG